MVSQSTMSRLFAFVLMICLAYPTMAASEVISPQIMDRLVKIIDKYYFVDQPAYELQIRKVLRLVLHDCMGGCDGSINVNNTANIGLDNTVRILGRSYNMGRMNITNGKEDNAFIKKYLSRADFMALVYLRTLSWSISAAGNGKPIFNNATPIFQYGRADNPNGFQNDDSQAPAADGMGSWSDNMQKITVGLKGLISQADLVALMGLHGAGMLSKEKSGFSNAWGPSTDYNKASHNFFKNLIGVGDPTLNMAQISVESQFGEKIQWRKKTGTSPVKNMLHADMGIYYDYIPDPVTHTTTYQYYPQGNNQILTRAQGAQYFPLAGSRAQLAFNFAKDNTLYINHLTEAFKKLITVPNQFSSIPLLYFYPQVSCVDGKKKCFGDILQTGCNLQVDQAC